MATKILVALSLLVAGHAYAAIYTEPSDAASFKITPVSKATPFSRDADALAASSSSQVNRPVIDIGQILDDTATDNLGQPIHFPVGEDKDLPKGCSCSVPPPVPVPAAAWLLGSGLLGLACVSRRLQRRDGAAASTQKIA